MKEAEDSSLIDHTSTKLHYSLVSFSSPSKSWKRQKIPQRVFTTPNGSNNQDYSCTYPLRIEHAGTVENIEIEIEKETKVSLRHEPYQKR